MEEKIKVFIWLYTKGLVYRWKYFQTRSERKNVDVIDSEKTIEYILKNRCSVSRFGDGEFQIVENYLRNKRSGDVITEVDTFQKYDAALAIRLFEVLQDTATPNFIKGIPYALKKSTAFKAYSRTFFEREALIRLPFLRNEVAKQTFCDTCFTRFYMERADIKDYTKYIAKLQSIWADKDILFVEGEQSRLGVANDLFSNACSVKRVLCPAVNAFEKYDEILHASKAHGQNKLILIALGQTATVLAYDLAKAGFQAIDIGHVDIEYEWYRQKATEKIAIKGKYVNEAKSEGGRAFSDCNDAVYQSEIICRVL